ncbi:MAG: NAD-dependent epimerase/dehydratase family protein [Rhodoglobus sp.]|uniref:NAD-dependent epimerase/dehydratase family protein n=1 Tax=Salinibacterium sp. G-O1 TaxID=3046208 RepID=UPI0024BB56D7|nr:NAD(P)-dependent oxidoreductase [Salinibacterium sp. G-O1]MDJ0335945.1 NAD(P)-dependent oxidoreductase [Salinibacterium sp. G-O1]
MRVAVTGASGFVGGAIATALAERGHDVTGFGRAPAGWHGNYEQWDITDGVRALSSDAVVHCAALADDWAPLSQSLRVNRLGTRTVVASFPGARVVHLSTSSVYDAFVPNVRVRESQIATRFLNSYPESKAAAEAEVGDNAVILRPHAVYGPGDTTLLPRLVAGVRGRRLVLPEGAKVRHTLTHIDNLVDAAELALTGPVGTYNIGDDGDVLLSDVLRELLDRRGLRDVAIASIPYRAAFATAGALEAIHRATGRGPGAAAPRLTRYAVSQLGLERTLDLTAARNALGYSPRPTSLANAEQW